MADNEIAKLAKAKNDADEEKRVKAEEEHASTSAKPTADKKAVNTNGENAKVEDPETAKTANTSHQSDQSDEATPARIAVPSGDAVKAARATLRQTFKDEFSKKKNEDKLAFSKTLRETAATEKDAVQKYALFVEAIGLATDAGNTDEAFATVTELCAVFDAVSSREKGIVLANFAKKTTKPEDFKTLVDRYLTVVNEAMGDSDPVAASDLLKDCKPLATKAKDKGLSSILSDKAKEIVALAAEIKKLKPSMDKLKESPDDPDANLVVGRYECFVRGDWEKGLPLLAKSSDETLKSIVALDLETTDAEQISKAADAWWTAADKEKVPAAKVAMKAHASDLYGKAIANLTGIAKATAEKRIEQSTVEAEASGIKLRSKQGGEYLIVDLSSRKLTYSASAPPDLLTKDTYKINRLVMRRVPAGDFMMGETNNSHKVKLTKDFYVGVFEVTEEQWEKVMKTNTSGLKDIGQDVPVGRVSWEDCQDFMKKLNGKTSSALTFRLPTEAEWEYACRGGDKKTSKGFEYSGSNNVDEVAWFKDNSGGKIHPVGKKKPNELGIYDMSGNVSEWCSDWFGDYPKEPVKDPVGAKSGSDRVHRGGSCPYDAGCCRSANCCHNVPTLRFQALGVRVVFASPVQ